MVLKASTAVEEAQLLKQEVHPHSGFDLPEISPTSPFWKDSHV
jgi:hypothetical protein